MLFDRLSSLWVTLGIIGCLWLAGCSTLSSGSYAATQPIDGTQARAIAENYLQTAQRSTSPEREADQLQAVHTLVDAGLTQEAKHVLNQVDNTQLPLDLSVSQHILQARIALAMQHPQVAISQLTSIQQHILASPTPVAIGFYQTLAQAYVGINEWQNGLQAHIALGELLTDQQAIVQNDQAIWDMLSTLSSAELTALVQSNNNIEIDGWVKLVLLLRERQQMPDDLLQAMQEWQQTYPDHPANQLLVDLRNHDHEDMSQLASVNQVALLLPLSGKLAVSSDAIRNGFFTAYYAVPAQQRPRVKLYDTAVATNNPQALVSLYQKALQDGAQMVIGPLTKENIQTVAQANVITVPTIALNTIDANESTSIFPWQRRLPEQLYQFGLSPQDEATQVAVKAWQQGKRSVLIVAPDTPWGVGVANAFTHVWNNQGGEVAQTLLFNQKAELSGQVKTALHVTDSDSRRRSLAKIIQQDVKTIPRRRQDVDMIFIAADPQTARQLLPLFKYHYAGDIPVYGISRIYSGHANKQADNDLNGIIFCDIPLLLEKQASYVQQRRKLRTLWSRDYQKQARLYGLGQDAYMLITQLNRLVLSPHFSIDGSTGRLSLTDDHHIYRTLVWAKMQNGQAIATLPGSGGRILS